MIILDCRTAELSKTFHTATFFGTTLKILNRHYTYTSQKKKKKNRKKKEKKTLQFFFSRLNFWQHMK